MLELYTDATPNGLKISIALEEMGLDYKTHQVFLGGEQQTAEFTALNPNQKIPVLVDDDLVVTESGAILLYLAEKTGKFLPLDPAKRVATIEALMFQMGSLGPMFGQYIVFAAAWGNKFPDVTGRYYTEVSRIMGVLNTRLEGQNYLAGDEFTIADMAVAPWIRLCEIHPACKNLPLDANTNLKNWWHRVAARPATQKGIANPTPFADDKQFEGFVKAVVGLGDLHK
ncbi:glutathione S-transferase family protein [Maritalea porphyrae]|uniref:Thiol:disulfide oxidoreductase n=1 Tax=Maritalea porphyrae TaxID=880732 RepID=A0ABQ5UPV4_9HYPH|nr:glutathione S-transferase N-terminal domain-containing protein [Maritalea porphyrae]GLQ16454.1 thiol:disulfide oxidoreductase [Maritalea porphyrae]